MLVVRSPHPLTIPPDDIGTINTNKLTITRKFMIDSVYTCKGCIDLIYLTSLKIN